MKMTHTLSMMATAVALAFPLHAQMTAPPPEERDPAKAEYTAPAPGVIVERTAPSAVIVETTLPREQIFVAPPVIPNGSPLHGGAVTNADQALLGQVLSALDSAPQMQGSTVTVVANNGEIVMNGSASDLVQAGRIERIAKSTGARVTAMIDPQGA